MAINKLDESKSALRLLISLSEINSPLMLSQLYKVMKRRYGTGRGTVNTAIETCTKLGLIHRERKRIGRNPMPSIFQSLTVKGEEVAEKCRELEKLISTKQNTKPHFE